MVILSAARRLHDNDDIRREICSYLSRRDVLSCTRASRKWLQTTSEVIWISVTLGQFMNILDTEPSEEQPSSSICSSTYYLPCVRHIIIPQGSLESTIPFARLVQLHYRHVVFISGDFWSIDFAKRTITSLRTVLNSKRIKILGRMVYLPGFKIVDNLEVHFSIGTESNSLEEHRWPCGIAPPLDPSKSISLDEAIDFNTRQLRLPFEKYETPIKAVRWWHERQPDRCDKWWNAIPLLRHLDTIIYTSSFHTSSTMGDLGHLLKNKKVRRVVIEDDRISLDRIPGIISLAWKYASKDFRTSPLTIEWGSFAAHWYAAQDFRSAAQTLKLEWETDDEMLLGSSIASGTPRLRCEFVYRIAHGLPDTHATREAIQHKLRAGTRVLNSLSNGIVVTLEEQRK